MSGTLNIAVTAAREAGRLLLRYFDRLHELKVEHKGHNDYVSEVDRQAEQIIIDIIKQAYPEHAIHAEESGFDGKDDHEWVIDPLDGTTNYLHGLPQFAISIAMKYRGVLDKAVVYDPISEEMFTASKGGGAYLNDRRIRVSGHKSLEGALIGTGFPYRASDAGNVDAYMDIFKELIITTAGLRRPGAASLDFAYVACGRYDGFWEFGLSEWDFAAGALLVQEAGGITTDVTGSSRFLQTGNVIAGNTKVHAELLKRIRPKLTPRLSGLTRS